MRILYIGTYLQIRLYAVNIITHRRNREPNRPKFTTFPKYEHTYYGVEKGGCRRGIRERVCVYVCVCVSAVHKETAILFRKQWPKKKTGLHR